VRKNHDDFDDCIDLGDCVDLCDVNDVIEVNLVNKVPNTVNSVNTVNKVPTPGQPLPAKARGAGGVEKVSAAPSLQRGAVRFFPFPRIPHSVTLRP
jgi:polyferredoxin